MAEVLARQQGRTISEVWEEALSLHRVRYEQQVIPAQAAHEETRRREPTGRD
jgi:hypothetical protein